MSLSVGLGCPKGGSHIYVAGTCWYCRAQEPVDPARSRYARRPYEFRESAVSAFGWTMRDRDFAKVRRTNERHGRPDNQEVLA